MTNAEQLAAFVIRVKFEDLSLSARAELRNRVLDAIGCAIGALGTSVASILRAHTTELGGKGVCTLLGGGSSAPDRAAFFNTALVR